MLVLRRKLNEGIEIDGDVVILITAIEVGGVRVTSGEVQLGIKAPESMRIHRLEKKHLHEGKGRVGT